MPYENPLFRPPSEANSLILQLSRGCSHNACTFCSMYEGVTFKIKSEQEIDRHIKELKPYHRSCQKIFLADGNFFTAPTSKIVATLKKVKQEFPGCGRISSYAGPKDLLKKSSAELMEIYDAGLKMLYLGVESGSDKVLSMVNKGVNSKQMIAAGQGAIQAGFKLSCMVISGLGGVALSKEHAKETSRVISAINPTYFSLLTLIVTEGTEYSRQLRSGNIILPTPRQIMEETYLMLQDIELDRTIFRSNHASNYVALAGILNKDKEKILSDIESALNVSGFKPEGWRGL